MTTTPEQIGTAKCPEGHTWIASQVIDETIAASGVLRMTRVVKPEMCPQCGQWWDTMLVRGDAMADVLQNVFGVPIVADEPEGGDRK